MKPFTFSAASLEPVMAGVSGERDGVAVNPTSDAVTMAFLDEPPEEASPGVSDWKTAAWETNATTDPDEYEAFCMVGPGGAATLAAGTWYVWVKVVDSPDIPVKYSGIIKVTP